METVGSRLAAMGIDNQVANEVAKNLAKFAKKSFAS
jgi:hypothetical protein